MKHPTFLMFTILVILMACMSTPTPLPSSTATPSASPSVSPSASPITTDTPTPTDTPMPTGTQGNCIIAPPDMVAWWAMDDAAGLSSTTIIDNSAGGHTGNLLDTALGPVAIGSAPGGTVVVSVPPGGAWPGSVLFPQAGNALFFVRTFALVGSNPVFDIGQNGLTITLWFNTAGAITPIQPLLDKWDVNSNSGYSLYLDSWDGNNKTYALKFNLNNTVIAFPTPIPSPTSPGNFPWYFVAVTVQNNGAATLYINSPNSQVPSSLQGATYTGSVASWQVSNTVPIGIAGNRSLLPPILSGNNPYRSAIGGYAAAELALDEVEIFNRALNLTTEIQNLYNLESQGVQKCQ